MPHQKVERAEAEAEVARFRAALRETHDLRGREEQTRPRPAPSDSEGAAADASGPDLMQRDGEVIQDDRNAEWAVAKVSDLIQERFAPSRMNISRRVS